MAKFGHPDFEIGYRNESVPIGYNWHSAGPGLATFNVKIYVGFVAAAVSMPMGGCRAVRPVDGRSLVSAETVGVIVAAEPAVL